MPLKYLINGLKTIKKIKNNFNIFHNKLYHNIMNPKIVDIKNNKCKKEDNEIYDTKTDDKCKKEDNEIYETKKDDKQVTLVDVSQKKENKVINLVNLEKNVKDLNNKDGKINIIF